MSPHGSRKSPFPSTLDLLWSWSPLGLSSGHGSVWKCQEASSSAHLEMLNLVGLIVLDS
jgi:hypothetical protein